MDYEIDIEEHDVLDNPVIKTIFPDISVIKKEITQYFEEEQYIEPEIEDTLQHKPEDLCIGNAQNTSVKLQYHTVIENETSQHSIQSNRIILGTKTKLIEGSEQSNNKELVLGLNPVLSTNNYDKKLILGSKCDKGIKNYIKTQIINNSEADYIQDENKIKFVLGSKPQQISANIEVKRLDNEPNVKLKEIKLVLQDINSYLNQNGRYCKQCCRLFLSKTALDIHRNKMHHNKLVYRNKNVKRITTKSRYKCSICGACVSNNSNLLRHYKNVHRKNITLTKNINNTLQKTQSQNSSIINDEYSLNKMKTSTKNKTKQSSIQCNICGISLTTYGSLTRHFMTKHKTNTNNQNSKHLVKIQEVEYNETLTVKEEQQITLPIKQNMKTESDEQINKYIACVEKRKDVTIKEHAKQVKSDAIHENKQRALKEECSTKETHTVKKDTQSLQVDYVDYSCEIRSNDEDMTPKYTTPSKKNNSPNDSNFCLHCNKEFADQKSLIEHMYEVLQPKRNSSGSIQNKQKEDKILYMCRKCSYYLPSVESYFAHLSRNHKTETFLEVNKKEFEAQCKYCPYEALNVTTHNKHVHSYHIDLMFSRMERENAEQKSSDSSTSVVNNHENSFSLESVLFECNKCCICFLSSDMAKDHKKHNIDSLPNWKCSICNHIFKEQDKDLHIKQHSFSQPLKVYNLNENAICNVLYNCTKCAIHFTEKRYQEHFLNCGSVPTDSAYCSTCDILVDKMEINHHKTQHEYLKDHFDFTIIDSNIIVDTRLKRKGINLEPQVKPKKRYYEQYNSFTYCPTCKSYLSYSGLKNESHSNKICFRLHTYPCDECGLVFTSSTLEKHKERHEKEKDLKIQDFKFFDLQGIQIRPAIPEYPQCKICKIHFLRKKTISRHICEETDFLTCDICNIKLSENTHKLHMAFHYYVMYKTSVEKGRNISIEQALETNVKQNLAKRESYLVSKKSMTQFESKIQIESKKNKPDEKLQNKMNTIVLGRKSVDIIPNSSMKIIEIEDSENIIDLVEETNIDQISKDNSLVIMYTCKPCGITVESYDEVINHCQTHYNGKEIRIASIKKCNKCSLKFDSLSNSDHERKVHSGVSKIEVLKFDPSCFTSKNMIWVKHIFQNFKKDIVKDILKNSIYQHEHRIRMECIQKGSLPFYVYKCDSCGNCVDPGSLYTHAENSCGKVRKHPCSICGMPFNSTFSRSNHEKLHRQIKNLSKRSLNIVLFNQSKDKNFNHRIFSTSNQYVLYQCRNCNRVAEKTILTDHVCDRNTLIKCITCGLLLSTEDFEAHSSKHKHLGNFCSENFKVILLGHKDSNTQSSDVLKTISPCFSGTVYDYTFYKCEICRMCLKNHDNIEKHSCIPNFELDRSICSECELNFPSGNMRHHMKQHMSDPHFIKENMNVISFNHKLQQQDVSLPTIKNKKANITIVRENQTETESRKNKKIHEVWKKCNNDAKKTNAMQNSHCDTDTEIDDRQRVKFKSSIEKHTKNCNHYKTSYKTVSENENNVCDCSKTNIDIDNVEKSNKEINVVGANNDKDNYYYTGMTNNVHEEVEILYKCKCGLHFLNKPKAKEHTKKCHPKELKQNCSKCHLLFNSSELFSHLLVHHKDKTKTNNFKVIVEEN